MSRRVAYVAGIFAVLVGPALSGCMDPSSGAFASGWGRWGAQSNSPPVESNIIRVSKFFSVVPWLSFDGDGSGEVDGVRCTVYLESAGTPKGVFGNGTIVVQMYRLDRDPLGHEAPTLIHEWELPPETAYPWRAKEESMLGWGYGLRLQWDEDLDVAGKQVAFVIRYVRDDGRIISSSRQVMKVPAQEGSSRAASARPPRPRAPRPRQAARSP